MGILCWYVHTSQERRFRTQQLGWAELLEGDYRHVEGSFKISLPRPSLVLAIAEWLPLHAGPHDLRSSRPWPSSTLAEWRPRHCGNGRSVTLCLYIETGSYTRTSTSQKYGLREQDTSQQQRHTHTHTHSFPPRQHRTTFLNPTL